ncbi:MAG: thermonuclease family protein [Bacillota bacterium]
MKQLALILTGILMIFTLIACSGSSNYPIDENRLEGKTQDEIAEMYSNTDWNVHFQERSNIEKDVSNEFIEYGMVSESSKDVYIIVSATLYDDQNLFEPVDLEYDGPRLDDAYYDLPLIERSKEGLLGGGGAFHVDHSGQYYFDGNPIGCIDGDTTVFDYPESIDEHVTNSTPSTRYLNVDTPETYSGGEEEWGQPASQFTCDSLDNAEDVVLQTDPGDFLTGDYDRLLAWVWILPEGEDQFELLNYNIVRQGLGQVAFEYGAGETEVTMYEGLTYNEWMHQGETLAREEERGMHNDELKDPYWDYATDSPNWDQWPN